MQSVAQTLEGYKREYADLNQPNYHHVNTIIAVEDDEGHLPAYNSIMSQEESRLLSLKEENSYLRTALSILEMDVRDLENGTAVYPTVSQKTALEVRMYEANEEFRQAKLEKEEQVRQALIEVVQELEAQEDAMMESRKVFQDEIQAVFTAVHAKRVAEIMEGAPRDQIDDLLRADHDALVYKVMLERVKHEEERLSKEENRIAGEVDAGDAKYRQVPEDSAALESQLTELKSRASAEENANELIRRGYEEKALAAEVKDTLAALVGINLIKKNEELQVEDQITGESIKLVSSERPQMLKDLNGSMFLQS